MLCIAQLVAEVDGLTEEWVGGVRKVGSEWEGDLGCLDFEGIRAPWSESLSLNNEVNICVSVSFVPLQIIMRALF
jgi:hypothetical protein